MIFTRDAIIGIVVLVVVLLGLGWYAFTHPLQPVSPLPGTGASTTTAPVATDAGPLQIADSGQFYTANLQYPSQTPLAGLSGSADVNAIALMKQWEIDSLAEFKKNFTDLDADYAAHLTSMNAKGALTIEYQTRQSAHTVSYVYTVYSDTLGAHPNTTYKTFTFDTSSGQNLSLAMLFAPSTDYLGFLSTYSRAQLPAMIAARENVATLDSDSMDMLNAGTAANIDNFANFYLDGSELVILFPPYAIGPYVLGSTELHIPTASITGIKADYQ